MAKGKSAAALFEVIHGSKGVESRKDRNLLSTPKWWFKGKTTAASASAPSVAPTVESVTATVPRVERVVHPVAPIFTDRASAGEPTSPASRASRPIIKLEMQYSTAVFLGFVVMAMIGGAYVLGQALRTSPTPVIASETTDQVLAGPVTPSVMENVTAHVNPAGPGDTVDDPNIRSSYEASTAARPVAQQQQNQRWSEVTAPATTMVDDAKRIMGLNYVLVQSYPDAATAEQVRDLLARNGKGATVEKSLPGWGAGWYSVVGTTGFDRIRNSREYTSYIQQIKDIGEKQGPKGKFKQFEPQPIKWKGNPNS
jgi:hypothetical protein